MAVYQIHRIQSEGVALFTIVVKPAAEGIFPTVIMRNPYVDATASKSDEELARNKMVEYSDFLEAGYVAIYQHCRGCGKSEGDCIPYINERKDGLALQAWIREQPFYNGEIYLFGTSYAAAVHYATAPFAPDIKGAVLRVMDNDRYNGNYRNGFYKVGLHGGWFVNMYKRMSMTKKPYVTETYNTLPLIDFSKNVFGESVPVFDEILLHPDRDDPFWDTYLGGAEIRHAEKNANIPLLLVGGFYDIFTGGMFDMWHGLDDATRQKSAFLVCPYGHSTSPEGQPIEFPDGDISIYKNKHAIEWFDSIRGKREFPFTQGKVTYYSLFENVWKTDDFTTPESTMDFPLGEGEVTYTYNPYAPASFRRGLSTNFGGTTYFAPPNSRYDVKSFFTPPFECDTLIRGKMKLKLTVRSDCEDTCFCVRLALDKPEGAYGLRDDITQISNFTDNYVPGEAITLDLTFDEHCFLVRAGERLRIDVSSSDTTHYVRHTNQKGLYALQTTARVAHNTLILAESVLTVPVDSPDTPTANEVTCIQ